MLQVSCTLGRTTCERDTGRGSVDDSDLLPGNSSMVGLPHDVAGIHVVMLQTRLLQHTNGSEVRAALDNWKFRVDVTTRFQKLTYRFSGEEKKQSLR